MRKLFNKDTFQWTEELIMVCFNKHMQVIGYYKISKGGTDTLIADPKVIYAIALNCTAHSIAIAHNHPAGDNSPSPEDIRVTNRIKASGEILGVQLLDHLIITEDSYYSFDDNNWGR